MAISLALIQRLTLFALLVNAAALLSPIINGGDSITYAALSQHIALSGDWVSLVLDGQDWLDKPHLPFWLTALSFQLFGVGAFAYKLPGFLFHVLGGYFTYRLARLFYPREAAWLALLVYASAFQSMDAAVEVKAETYLNGLIMGACYYWLRHDAQTRTKHLLLGALFTAGAMMTKGVFTLITVFSGLVALWLYRGEWRKLTSGKWLMAYALSLLFTAPEWLALYLQFDAHPEKIVFGQSNVSGIRFFFWDSQFGRFFNSGPIRDTSGGGHPLYFVGVFLWAFLPWVPLYLAALWRGARRFSGSAAQQREAFVFLGAAFFVTFILFSATPFQLDHYLVILFPFAAILCGGYLHGLQAERSHWRLPLVQGAIAMLLLGLAVALAWYVHLPWVLAVALALVGVALSATYALYDRMRAAALLVLPLCAVLTLFAVLTLTAALTYRTVGVAWNAGRALAAQERLPVYVHRMDLVHRELALYHAQPVATIAAADLPPSAHYLLVRAEDVTTLTTGRAFSEVAQGRWVVHKTGTLPRLLRLARGQEPLEDIRILKIEGASNGAR
ncbi:MAG: hypothetical protein Fur0040_04930 [Sideroxydans sp.]